MFTITVVNSMEPSASADSNVIGVDLPVDAKTHTATTPRCIHSVGSKGKVLWTVGGSEGEAHR